MQIDEKVIAPENYSNPRFIEIKNTHVKTLYERIIDIQKGINPKLERLEEITKKKEELKKPFTDYCAEVKQEEEELIAFMEGEDAKAKKIKDKLVPMVQKAVKGQMGDFDEFVGLAIQGDTIVAKVNDRIEEFVKIVRQQKEDFLAQNKG